MSVGITSPIPTSFHIKAIAQTGQVWLNGEKLEIFPQLKSRADKFAWGYKRRGSECQVLAMVLTVHLYGLYMVRDIHRLFQMTFVDTWPGQSDLDITVDLTRFNAENKIEKLSRENDPFGGAL